MVAKAELAVVLVDGIELFPGLGGGGGVDLGAGVHLALEDAVGALVGVDGVVVGKVPPELVVEERGVHRLPVVETLVHHDRLPLEGLANFLLDPLHLGEGLGADQEVLLHQQLLPLYALYVQLSVLVVAVLPVLSPKELIEIVVGLGLWVLLLGLRVLSAGLELFLEVVKLVPVLAGVVILLFKKVDDVPQAH